MFFVDYCQIHNWDILSPIVSCHFSLDVLFVYRCFLIVFYSICQISLLHAYAALSACIPTGQKRALEMAVSHYVVVGN